CALRIHRLHSYHLSRVFCATMFIFLLILLILDSLILVGVVLLQAGQGGGLAAMGGGASTDTFLGGRQAVTILTKMSWWCGGIFLALSLVLAGLSARGTRMRSVLEARSRRRHQFLRFP